MLALDVENEERHQIPRKLSKILYLRVHAGCAGEF